MKTYTFTLEVEKNSLRIQDYSRYTRFVTTLTKLKEIRTQNVYFMDIPNRKKSSWIPLCLLREWGSPNKIKEAIDKYKEITTNPKTKNFYLESVQQINNFNANGKTDIYTVVSYKAEQPMDDILKEILNVFQAEANFS